MSDKLGYYSQSTGILFILAKKAAKRAYKSRGTIGEQYETMNSVVLCAIVAEAAINEMGVWFDFHHLRPPLNIPYGMPQEFERLEIKVKWILFPIMVRQRSFDKGMEPWQSFNALIDLRNMIVHLKDDNIPKSVSGLLKAKGFYSDGFLGFEVAIWACNTIAGMFDTLTKLLDIPDEWLNQIWLFTPKYYPYGLSTPGDKVDDSQLKR